MPDLVQLAEQYVSLTSQLEDVRNAMRLALANGAAGGAVEVRPTPGGKQPAAGKTSKTTQPKQPAKPGRAEIRANSAAQDQAVVSLLKQQPGLRVGQIAAALQANPTTITERMRRLSGKGQVRRDDGGGWAATSPP